MSSSEGKVFVTDEASQNITTLDFNGTYLLDGFTTLILDFYTVIDTKEGRGFLIEYEAGFCIFLFSEFRYVNKKNALSNRS